MDHGFAEGEIQWDISKTVCSLVLRGFSISGGEQIFGIMPHKEKWPLTDSAFAKPAVNPCH
jgi:hypothetical protein